MQTFNFRFEVIEVSHAFWHLTANFVCITVARKASLWHLLRAAKHFQRIHETLTLVVRVPHLHFFLEDMCQQNNMPRLFFLISNWNEIITFISDNYTVKPRRYILGLHVFLVVRFTKSSPAELPQECVYQFPVHCICLPNSCVQKLPLDAATLLPLLFSSSNLGRYDLRLGRLERNSGFHKRPFFLSSLSPTCVYTSVVFGSPFHTTS